MTKPDRTLRPLDEFSYVDSLLSFLDEAPQGVDFKLYDWVRTLDDDKLLATDGFMCDIYEFLGEKGIPSAHVRDFIDAAVYAAGAECPDADPEDVTSVLLTLLEKFNDVNRTEMYARIGELIITERIGIWPSTAPGYEYSRYPRFAPKAKERPDRC